MTDWLSGIYIFAAIFGAGVTAVDMLGMLGHLHSDGDGGGHDGGFDQGGAGYEGNGGLEGAGQGAGGDHGGFGHDTAGDVGGMESAGSGAEPGGGDAAGGHAGGHAGGQGQADLGADGDFGAQEAGGQHGPEGGRLAVQSHTGAESPAIAILSVLRYLRMAVYFSLGFGPVGLVAISSGAGPGASLMWALPCGAVSAWLARAVFRFQQRDVDSSVTNKDLFFRPAEVVVAIGRGQMGRVRVVIGQSVIERYAYAADPQATFRKGDKVYITRITDECVYVEPPAGSEFLDA